MQENANQILGMLNEGKISVEQATTLLQSLQEDPLKERRERVKLFSQFCRQWWWLIFFIPARFHPIWIIFLLWLFHNKAKMESSNSSDMTPAN